MFSDAACLVFAVFYVDLVRREWRAPLGSRYFRVPSFWPWSEDAWLGWKATDAPTPLIVVTVVLAVHAPRDLFPALAGLLAAELALAATLYAFAKPRRLIPHALRSTYKGYVSARVAARRRKSMPVD